MIVGGFFIFLSHEKFNQITSTQFKNKVKMRNRGTKTERKQLKKKLAKLKHYKAILPRLIDCSNVYGDNYYSKNDLADADKQIEEVEKRIAEISR